MTGPDGKKFHGWWRVTAVDAPHSLELVDGFADDEGVPTDTLPQSTMRMELTRSGGTTRMVLRSQFASREHMDQLLKMQMDEGLRAAVGQMDALLGE